MTIQEIKEVTFGLNNNLRLKILSLLINQPRSTSELFRLLKEDETVYRQSIHRALEILRNSKLVKKKYDEDKKVLVYIIKSNKILIDLEKLKVFFQS